MAELLFDTEDMPFALKVSVRATPAPCLTEVYLVNFVVWSRLIKVSAALHNSIIDELHGLETGELYVPARGLRAKSLKMELALAHVLRHWLAMVTFGSTAISPVSEQGAKVGARISSSVVLHDNARVCRCKMRALSQKRAIKMCKSQHSTQENILAKSACNPPISPALSNIHHSCSTNTDAMYAHRPSHRFGALQQEAALHVCLPHRRTADSNFLNSLSAVMGMCRICASIASHADVSSMVDTTCRVVCHFISGYAQSYRCGTLDTGRLAAPHNSRSAATVVATLQSMIPHNSLSCRSSLTPQFLHKTRPHRWTHCAGHSGIVGTHSLEEVVPRSSQKASPWHPKVACVTAQDMECITQAQKVAPRLRIMWDADSVPFSDTAKAALLEEMGQAQVRDSVHRCATGKATRASRLRGPATGSPGPCTVGYC